MFGLGWAVADACPVPIATQVGQGIPWALFTMTGVVAGVYLFFRRGGAETEPATDGLGRASPTSWGSEAGRVRSRQFTAAAATAIMAG